jgi:hypothetical protein
VNIAKIISDNEQDRAACEQWWRDSSTADKILVWLEIQKPHKDTAKELVTRFAQLAFAEMVEKFGIGDE